MVCSRGESLTHRIIQMKLFKVAGLGLVAIVAVVGFKIEQGYAKHEILPKRQPIETKKDPIIIAADQLTFVLCKKKQGQYKSYHDEDMRKVLSIYNIDNALLMTNSVKNLAQKYIDNGTCDMYTKYDRIGDMVPKKGEGESQFKNLVDWKREVVLVVAEAECKTQLGEFTSQERENYVMSKLEEVFFPNDLMEDDMQAMITENLPAFLWLTFAKKNNGNCLWMPE